MLPIVEDGLYSVEEVLPKRDQEEKVFEVAVDLEK